MRRFHSQGFSLLELLIVITIFSFIAVLLANLFEATSNSLVSTKDQIKQFGDARRAFEYMTANLEQATLNTYLDYKYAEEENDESPKEYMAQSDLQFKVDYAQPLLTEKGDGRKDEFQTHCVFFQAPLGSSDRYTDLSNLLNGRGYFVEFGNDLSYRPDFLIGKVPPKYRFRLKEFRPPSEFNIIYKELQSGELSDPIPEFNEWFRVDSQLYDSPLSYDKVVRNIADNVIGLIVSPQVSPGDMAAKGYQSPVEFAPVYQYDSRLEFPSGNEEEKTQHQLPPLLKVIMITISEKSAVYLQDRHAEEVPPPIMAKEKWFKDAAKLEEDLEAFTKQLSDNGIDFRVFQTMIQLQASKWRDEV